MALPRIKPPWTLEKAAGEVVERVDRFLRECTKSKNELGTSYDTIVAMPAYIQALNRLLDYITQECGYPLNRLGPAIMQRYSSELDWATDVRPSYVALLNALPAVEAGIRARQAEIGALLVIDAIGARSFQGDAGATVNAEFSALMDSMLAHFETE